MYNKVFGSTPEDTVTGFKSPPSHPHLLCSMLPSCYVLFFFPHSSRVHHPGRVRGLQVTGCRFQIAAEGVCEHISVPVSVRALVNPLCRVQPMQAKEHRSILQWSAVFPVILGRHPSRRLNCNLAPGNTFTNVSISNWPWACQSNPSCIMQPPQFISCSRLGSFPEAVFVIRVDCFVVHSCPGIDLDLSGARELVVNRPCRISIFLFLFNQCPRLLYSRP